MALTYDPITGLATARTASSALPPSPTLDPGGGWTWQNIPTVAPQIPGVQMPALPDLTGAFAPIWAQMTADLQASGIADAAARDAARQRAIIQFGEAPTDFSRADLTLINGGGDPNAFLNSLGNAPQLAQQNTAAGLSTVARLTDADKQALQQINNVLGARGLFRSGETGYQYGREALNYRTAQYDARQKLLDYLAGVQGQFLTGERQRQQAAAQLELQKAQQAAEQQMAQANWALQQAILNAQTSAQQAQANAAAANSTAGNWVYTPPASPAGTVPGIDPATGLIQRPVPSGGGWVAV